MTDTPLTEVRNRPQHRPTVTRRCLRLINDGVAVPSPANNNEPQGRDLVEPHR